MFLLRKSPEVSNLSFVRQGQEQSLSNDKDLKTILVPLSVFICFSFLPLCREGFDMVSPDRMIVTA